MHRAVSMVCILTMAASSAVGGPSRLRMIDQGYEDLDPLATSLRVQTFDLREPTGFSLLFEDSANPGTYVRVSGGTYMVSTETEYAVTKDGVFALIPAGAVFYIGSLPEPMPWETPDGASPPPRGEAVRLAKPVRGALRAQDLLLAQIAAPRAVRAMDAERVQRDRVERATRGEASAPAPSDVMGEESERAARLREISTRVLRDR